MKLVRFANPYYGVNKSLVDDLFNSFIYNDTHACNCNPATNILENTKDFVIEVSLPGFSKEDVQISVENDVLKIKSSKKQEKESNYRYSRKEFSTFAFEKSFRLDESVETEKIEAKFENGILYLTLPKKETVASKSPVSIAIQ